MPASERVVPLSLAAAAIASLVIPGLSDSPRAMCFVTAVLCATAYAIYQRPLMPGQRRTVVEVAQIKFIHWERGKEDRPGASLETTEVYEQALRAFHEKKYDQAARLYGQAFHVGQGYWPAKINQGFSYQAMGDLDEAMRVYDDVVSECPEPRFRRQALGNAGDILMARAQAAAQMPAKNALMAHAYEKYVAAHECEETFVSLYNLWQASLATGRDTKARELLSKLERCPEYAQLPDDQKRYPKRSEDSK